MIFRGFRRANADLMGGNYLSFIAHVHRGFRDPDIKCFAAFQPRFFRRYGLLGIEGPTRVLEEPVVDGADLFFYLSFFMRQATSTAVSAR